jgi:hypothetical protein
MKSSSLILTIILTTGLYSCGQTIEPLEISKNIFRSHSFLNNKTLVDTGYKGNLDSNMLKFFSFNQFYLLQQSNTDAVVSLVITDSTGEKSNSYLYYVFDSTWKLRDMRTFRLHYIPLVKKALEKATQLEIDSIVDLAKKDVHRNFFFRTQDEYKDKLNEYRFVCETDSAFVEYFLINEVEFKKIKTSILPKLDAILSKPKAKPGEHEDAFSGNGDIDFSDSFRIQMRNLKLETIQFEGDDYFPDCLDFRIIQTGDFSVGYIYVNDERNIPKIKPSGLMMTRKIKSGWYLYRTN